MKETLKKLFTWNWFKTEEGKKRYKLMLIGYSIGIGLAIFIIRHYIPSTKEIEEYINKKDNKDIEDKQ